MDRSDFKYYGLLVIAMFFWGLSWPLSQIMVGQATPFQVGFFRFLIASIVYLVLLFSTNFKKIRTYTWKSIRDFTILGILGIFGYGTLFLTAMTFTTSSQGAVIAGIQPALLAISSYFIFGEKLHPKWRYFGIILSFIGVIIIIGVQPFIDFNVDHLIGNVIVFIAFLFWCGYTLYGKKVMKKHSSLETTTWSSFTGMLMFGMAAIIENKWILIAEVSWDFWLNITLLGLFTTVVSFFLYFYVIGKIGAVRSGVFINLVPVFGTLLSIVILHQENASTLWIGLIIISMGILLLNYPKDFSVKQEENGLTNK
ncbi:DMT family transporter [Promethearchaeum syntrophicum]|uniref:DMT family transporter n=1 Tax=Promethearchaeum syntrophicum TaxID=2594042 RepID=A0A5B9DDC0_9ARCH|nr:DMT family transporter [Candidatus Prometheoarchaeum syntrophicum]QEE17031.1 putative DMT superfamily transporter inner membrane protein [Candidatus Prometheoarchaeum syntrophicum]